jgi:hypothetical protein
VAWVWLLITEYTRLAAGIKAERLSNLVRDDRPIEIQPTIDPAIGIGYRIRALVMVNIFLSEWCDEITIGSDGWR